jgi:Flp pilus assembly protein TadD
MPNRLVLLLLIAISLTLNFPLFLSAQDTAPETIANRGFASYGDIPETKKGTVVFGDDANRSSSSQMTPKTTNVQTPYKPSTETKKGTIVFGSKPAPASDKLASEEGLNTQQKQARSYRSQGLQLQRAGNIDGALSLYQKAKELDPHYAVVDNDLGIAYEAKGFTKQAEDSYLRAIAEDPHYLSSYSNLALLYESKRDFDNASYYWKKRIELGDNNDPWTQKAKEKLFNLGSNKFPYSQDTDLEDETKLSEVQKQARSYRSQGMQLQEMGNLDDALKLYQKAKELDPAYAVVYNDLGVVYEAQGRDKEAENSYLRAIDINPNYLSSYSNLALLYENRRDLDNAAFYWQKRAELGLSTDPWTARAVSRLDDINLIMGRTTDKIQEEEVLDLMQDVASKKADLRKDDKKLAKDYFQKAKVYYDQGEELAAYKEALNASQLDPNNAEIEKFLEKVHLRLLSK